MRKEDKEVSIWKALMILTILAAVFIALTQTEQLGRWIDNTVLRETQMQLQQILQ